MVLAYRGTRYHGWAHQEIPPTWKGPVDRPDQYGVRGLLTVHREVTRALQYVLKHPVGVIGASRTDTGVHAKAQLAHFDTTVKIPLVGMRRAINHALPEDILVRTLEPVPFEFHAIRSVLRKRYQYLIWHHEDRPPLLAGFAWHRWQEIDVDAMREAAKYLVGLHDFASFAKAKHKRRSTIREIYGIDISYRPPRLVIGVEGNGFLWHMVRIIVGTLTAVGMGLEKPEAVKAMLEARDRKAALSTAPPAGLYLQWVRHRECGDEFAADELLEDE